MSNKYVKDITKFLFETRFPYLKEEAENIMDISDWKSQSGTQYGSNPGGIHEDESGQKYYVKMPRNEDQARQEVASAKIHEMMGVSTLKPRLIRKDGRVGTATVWNDDLVSKRPREFENLNQDQARHIARIHHAGVITKNWDTVGLSHDNILFHKDTDQPVAVDQGGSFNFRAQGGHKDYSPDVSELQSYRNPSLNPQAHHVFSHTFQNHPDVEKEELTGVRNLNYDSVNAAFRESGLANHEDLSKTLMKRRDMLIQHYGE